MSDELGPLAAASRRLVPGASDVSARTPGADRRGRFTRSSSRPTRGLELLTENRSKLDSLAAALIEHETLDEDDAYAAAGVEHAAAVPEPTVPLAAALTVDSGES